MEISIDSRSINNPEETLFFALVGNNHNGHDYIASLYYRGGRRFVVSEWREVFDSMVEAEFIRCEDVLSELQRMASDYRQTIKAEVVGISGSNGKTIVKEWIAQLIGDDMVVCRSPRSYNSQVGVPLSVFGITDNCEVALIEAGISKVGEMERHQGVIAPKVGIFTHLGDAHGENFVSMQEKLEEKVSLFRDAEVVICKEGVLAKAMEVDRFFTWGKVDLLPEGNMDAVSSDNIDVKVISEKMLDNKRVVEIEFGAERFRLEIPFLDEASYENCMTAVTYLLYKGFPVDKIVKRVPLLQPVAMRLEVKQGINRCVLINDFYNSDLESFKLALTTLSMQDASKRKIVVLSDFVDVGLEKSLLYKSVAKLINKAKISVFIGIGEDVSSYSSLFKIGESAFYHDTDSFLKQQSRDMFCDAAILLKGARKFRFENIATSLQKQSHISSLEVDMNAMVHNLSVFRSQIPTSTKIAVMVKAFSYGSGSGEVANLLQYNGVDYLMVAFADEGVELRSMGVTIPIAVMNTEVEAFDSMIESRLEPTIYSLDVLESFSKALEYHGVVDYPVHLKLNTGMNRSGVNPDEVPSVIDFLKSKSSVLLCSVFSHLAASGEPNYDEFTLMQINTFTEVADSIQSHFDYKVMRHILNSSGIERFPQYSFDMVRLGIGLHGITAIPSNTKLEVVSTFKTYISSIREVSQHETVGYSRKGVLSRPSKIAVIPVGYADGLNRHLGCGVGEVTINGKRLPIIGNVCMDATMIDVTGANAQIGDPVEIFGKNITVIEIASKLDTIPYEVFTTVSHRVKRVYFRE